MNTKKMFLRRDEAYTIRKTAARMARNRPDQPHIPNGDEIAYRNANYAMTFTKGLEHNETTLLAKNITDVAELRDAIDSGYVDDFNAIACPPNPTPKPLRKWEAPTAGFVHDLQGPDAQEVTMPPAPELGSTELIYEMAEVYELALLRDVNLSALTARARNAKVMDAITRLNAFGSPGRDFKSRPRILDAGGVLTAQNIFRGSSPKVDIGPYLSQFLLMGSETLSGLKPEDGYIMYGAQQIDQRVPVAVPKKDYMMDETSYLNVQNGLDVRDNTLLYEADVIRFIQTPRDLATYVHDDALYQAYLNACLLLLSQKTPFDPYFDKLSGTGRFNNANAGGFALWGGPHILSLLTEVATRALKAVRFQKFNVHLRLRPEALAARLHAYLTGRLPDTLNFKELKENLLSMRIAFPQSMARAIQRHVRCQTGRATMLLPMAFQEGSPMHPSYGAGHAVVAGACVTVLKAFFDTTTILIERPCEGNRILFGHPRAGDTPVRFEVCPHEERNLIMVPPTNPAPTRTTNSLGKVCPSIPPLTLEGELNKLAANISIGRNMAGVHYFSDYYDSLRLGEEIAIGILEEQALTYPKDRFAMSLVTFDGKQRII